MQLKSIDTLRQKDYSIDLIFHQKEIILPQLLCIKDWSPAVTPLGSIMCDKNTLYEENM